jgi:hypothetical protein
MGLVLCDLLAWRTQGQKVLDGQTQRDARQLAQQSPAGVQASFEIHSLFDSSLIRRFRFRWSRLRGSERLFMLDGIAAAGSDILLESYRLDACTGLKSTESGQLYE